MNTEVIISDSPTRIMDINNYVKEEIAVHLQIEYVFSNVVDHVCVFSTEKSPTGDNNDIEQCFLK